MAVLACSVPATRIAAQNADGGTADAPRLSPADYRDEERLAALVWEHSPEVLEAREAAAVAASELTRARTLPNPQLDFTWATIPIGRTNPSGLDDPLGNVPSYTVGISELIELAKRGPRRAAAEAQVEAARARAVAVFADRYLDLLEDVGKLAKNEVRVGLINGEVRGSDELLGLERARAAKGEIAEMMAERSEAENARLIATRDAARAELESSRAECSALLATECPAFDSGRLARRFLADEAASAMPEAWSAEIEQRRPDIAALGAELHAAGEKAVLARRHAVPDVTVRLGYTYDTFEVSGNQRQSLAAGVQIPVPVADRGQADLEAASAAMLRAEGTRASLIESGRLTLEAATRQRSLTATRIAQMRAALEKADSLRNAMQEAARQGGVSQVDVLLARRHYQELLLEGNDLEADAYDDVLKIRRAAAIFPRPDARG